MIGDNNLRKRIDKFASLQQKIKCKSAKNPHNDILATILNNVIAHYL